MLYFPFGQCKLHKGVDLVRTRDTIGNANKMKTLDLVDKQLLQTDVKRRIMPTVHNRSHLVLKCNIMKTLSTLPCKATHFCLLMHIFLLSILFLSLECYSGTSNTFLVSLQCFCYLVLIVKLLNKICYYILAYGTLDCVITNRETSF